MNPTFWLILTVCLFMLAAFLTGYTMAENRERKIHHQTKLNLQMMQLQKHELLSWVRKNWPNEFAAYERGHTEGYQQGILQAGDLEDQVE